MFKLLVKYCLLCSTLFLIIYSNEPCPTLDEFLARSPYLAKFNPKVYQGIWYELAFFDYTQFPKACGCTHLNWTLSPANASIYIDDFVTSCPYEPMSLRTNYTIHMNGTANNQRYPFSIPETGFHMLFNNSVVYFRTSGIKNDTYDRAIQYQCNMDRFGTRIFTGINFLSRTRFNSDVERKDAIDQMIDEAMRVGIEEQYLKQLHIVQWETC